MSTECQSEMGHHRDHSRPSFDVVASGYPQSRPRFANHQDASNFHSNASRTMSSRQTDYSASVTSDDRSLVRVESATTRSSTRTSAFSSLRSKFSSKFSSRPIAESYGGRETPATTEESAHRSSGSLTVRSTNTSNSEVPMKPRALPRQEMKGLEQAASVMRWPGGGKPAQAWGKLKKDDELWDPSGDTLIYYSRDRPEPSFRIQSSLLEETRSPSLCALLQEGSRFTKIGNFWATPAGSSSSNGSVRSRDSNRESESRFRLGHGKFGGRKAGRSSPPASAPSSASKGEEAPAMYEISLPAPEDATRMELLRFHITTRNFVALLQRKPIVGLTFYQAVIDLHDRCRWYMPDKADCTTMITSYLGDCALDDLRNDPGVAIGLLSWSEEPGVRWHEGWREAFVHAVGMYDRMITLTAYRDVSLVTRALLERAHLDLQLRVEGAEERLAGFDFDDVWPRQSAQAPPARASFDRCRKFLKRYYESAHKTWPFPVPEKAGGRWLTRDVAIRLQKDFCALYDHLVDRDVGWEGYEHRGERKAKMIRQTKGAMTFRPDSDSLPMTAMVTGFDDRHEYHHIPHPYPLQPSSIPVQYNAMQSILSGRRDKALEKRTALAYHEASNVILLGSNRATNALVEQFINFEKSDQLGEVDPAEARKGRWILLYCILQILADIATDTPNMWCKDGVSYFLNTRLKGTPPWRTQTDRAYPEASRLISHCWTAPKTWSVDHAIGSSSLKNHRQIVVTTDGIGDGIGREPSFLSSPDEDTLRDSSSLSDRPPSAPEKGPISDRDRKSWTGLDGSETVDAAIGQTGGDYSDNDRSVMVKASSGGQVHGTSRLSMQRQPQVGPRDAGKSYYVPPQGW